MKPKYLLIFILVFIIFGSCGKNDDDKVITGTWNYSNIDFSITPPNIQLASALQIGLSFSKPDKFSLTFNEDKTLVGVIRKDDDRKTLSGTYTISDENLNFDFISDFSIDTKYSFVNKNKLTISYTFVVNNISIMELLKQAGVDDYNAEMIENSLANSLVGVDTIAFSLHFDKQK